MTRENLEKLKDIQDRIAERKLSVKEKREAFEKSIEAEKGSISALEAQETLYKEGIASEALEEFKETGKKTLMGGVKVQVKKTTTVTYRLEEALKFAKEKGLFLMLDKKTFETAAPTLGVDFVKIQTSTTEKVTFPTKGIVLED